MDWQVKGNERFFIRNRIKIRTVADLQMQTHIFPLFMRRSNTIFQSHQMFPAWYHHYLMSQRTLIIQTSFEKEFGKIPYTFLGTDGLYIISVSYTREN